MCTDQSNYILQCRLLVVTAIVGVCAEFLVSAIEDVTKIWHISETFVGKVIRYQALSSL
jgi:Ca2+/H+ antiporter